MIKKATLFLIITLIASTFTSFASSVGDDIFLKDKKPKKEKSKKDTNEVRTGVFREAQG